ncbi:hypothetical protein [Nannocystis pusilla]|uniref:hypothetical protein n=1 Tax=Nannocystis pusilla TaxID=889268 RepID=UPI003B793B5B
MEQLADWVMNGRCTVSDLEFYEQYNQEYRPSDWMRKPIADEEFFTFVQDGAGGQYALHLVGDGDVDRAPVVKLGRDGEVAVLGRDLIDFAWLIACGVEPIGVGDNGQLRGPSRPRRRCRRGCAPSTRAAPSAPPKRPCRPPPLPTPISCSTSAPWPRPEPHRMTRAR